MMELQEILHRVSVDDGDDAILATLVDVQGSGYRVAGARMLIDRNGKSIGTVSGGCLEADILERARKVLETGEPIVVSYDTTKDENSPFGLGMGCRGVVRVLLEPARHNNALAFIRDCFTRREQGVVSTLISKTPNVQAGLASRLFLKNDTFNGMALNGLSFQVGRDATAVLLETRSRTNTYETADTEVEFFHEVIKPPTAILIFGAGHDAVPVARLAGRMGWRVAVFDHRPAWVSADRFPEADELIVSRPENIDHDIFVDPQSIAVVMNHNYDLDREILARLLVSKCRYIGMLGPKQRTERLLDELVSQGITFKESQLEKLYAPVGLDIGASTPEGIALAIVAEIQAVLSGREGGSLKYRQAPIYDR